MCPNRKLEWFKTRKFGANKRDCTTADIKKLRGIVVKIWKKKYAITSTEEETEAVKIAKTKKGKKAAVINFLFS